MRLKRPVPYDINWFPNNMEAILAGRDCFGNCSACSLRNLKKFCYVLSPVCSYVSEPDDISESVYWMPKKTICNTNLLMLAPPIELVQWFYNTPVAQARTIAGEMVKNSALKGR